MTLLYPGSFDPLTLGHLDIIRRGEALCKEHIGMLIVAVADNPHKTPLFSSKERVAMLREAVKNIFAGSKGIKVAAFSGLIAECARQYGATAILRGARGGEDFSSEARYAWHNRLFYGMETLILPADAQYTHISSRIVREAAEHIYRADLPDDALKRLVPEGVREALSRKFTNRR